MSKIKKSGARKWVLGLLAGVSSIAVFASCAPAFAAEDAETKAEIRALKEQLKRLEHRLESAVAGAEADEARGRARRARQGRSAGGQRPAAGRLHLQGRVGALAVRLLVEGRHNHARRLLRIRHAPPRSLHRRGSRDAVRQYSVCEHDTSHTDETRFTARRSRFILGTDADLDNVTHAKMYLATDFLSDAQTGTLTQSNSWNLRWRELYVKLDRSDFGLHLSAGQMYTLISMNSRGTTPDTFITPPVIDDQYMPGYTWSRQVGIRLSKDLPYNFQYAFAAEMPYTSLRERDARDFN